MKKLKKIITTIAAISSSLITAASMALTPVNAENKGLKYIPLKVYLEKQQLAVCPTETFRFTVAPSTVAANTTDSSGNVVKTGVSEGAYFKSGEDSIAMAPLLQYDLTTTLAEAETPTQITLNADAFSSPGVYRYEVKEVKGSQEGIYYDDSTIYVDLYVIYTEGDAANGKTIKNMIAYKKVNGSLQKIGSNSDELSFTNKSLQSATLNTECVHNLSVTERVVSESGIFDEGKEFSITISITRTAEDTNKAYAVVYGEISDDPDQIDVDNLPAKIVYAGTPLDIKLKKDQTLTVYGLSVSDKFEVTHKETENYAIKFHEGSFGSYGSAVSSGIISMDTHNHSYNFTAKKAMIIPTGLFTDSMPFIFLAICALAFGFVMFHHHQKEEY